MQYTDRFLGFSRRDRISMTNKLFKISISFDSEKTESVRVKMTDNASGYKEEINGSLENIKERVHQRLELWAQEGRGGMTPAVCEFYATFAEYEARRRAAKNKN